VKAKKTAYHDEAEKDAPYFIEVDQNGCSKCGEGRSYRVIGPVRDESTSYAEEEDAQAVADSLNEAYELGQQVSMSFKFRDVLPIKIGFGKGYTLAIVDHQISREDLALVRHASIALQRQLDGSYYLVKSRWELPYHRFSPDYSLLDNEGAD
jgi:hypothetical protein